MQNLSFSQALERKRKKGLIHRKDPPLSITTIYKYKPIKQSNEELFSRPEYTVAVDMALDKRWIDCGKIDDGKTKQTRYHQRAI